MDDTQPSKVRVRGLSLRAVLGIPGAAAERERILMLQFARAPRILRMQVLAQGIAALAALWLFAPIGKPAVMTAWLGIVAGSLAVAIGSAAVLARGPRPMPARLAQITLAAALTGNAAVWGAPLLLFGELAPDTARLEMWTILAVLMAVWAVVVPALPQAAMLFAAVTGGAAAASFAMAGAMPMAAIALGYAAIIALGAAQASRDFLYSRLAEDGIAEHSEVVSLLLKEFEDEVADWLWETDVHRRVRDASRRFALSLGAEPGEIEGRSLIQLVAGAAWAQGEIHASVHELAERLKHHEAFSHLLVQVNVAGAVRWWELSGKPRLDADGRFAGFRGVGSDVTAQRESSDQIAWLARYDTLTGLPNRRMLTEAIGEALVRTRTDGQGGQDRCAFLMIDLDRFKTVNDTLGHLVGDQLLAAVSARLQAVMGVGDTCGRLGGDEFAVVIDAVTGPDHIDRLARAVIERLSEPYTVDNHTLYVGVSVGSAAAPRDGSTVETLMRNADLALYRAKGSGGGRHCPYEPVLHAQAEERRVLEMALRGALERGELSVLYQPVVSAGDERIVSFEALVRWHSRQHGPVSAETFIPIAEDTRLIVPIGEWVLRAACREAMRWPEAVRVAVNVSGEQLLDARFLDTLVGTLASTGLPPQRLDIEVTENIFSRDPNTVRAVLERALALGCGVSLDDFGTGYSSLAYLRTLRFSTIKVHRSFVQGAARGNPESLAIIRAVVAMADSLEMATTAEGVETDEELALIRRLGCRRVQGHYYGRPIAADEVVTLFDQRAAGARGGKP